MTFSMRGDGRGANPYRRASCGAWILAMRSQPWFIPYTKSAVLRERVRSSERNASCSGVKLKSIDCLRLEAATRAARCGGTIAMAARGRQPVTDALPGRAGVCYMN